jgi:hypothetical protein
VPSKIPVIREFVTGLMELRAQVKEDARTLLAKLDLRTLSDRDALSTYLEEMLAALAKKHLVNNGKVPKQASGLIKSYVRGMVKP